MSRLVIAACLVPSLVGCRISLEDEPVAGGRCEVDMMSQACIEADMHSDFAWIQTNIFNPGCTFSGCHNGANTNAGRMDLRAGMSHSHIVDVSSRLEPTRKLVVANDVNASYLMLMVGAVEPQMASPPGQPPPASVGYMPQSSGELLCCQKLDALERWISAGAPSN